MDLGNIRTLFDDLRVFDLGFQFQDLPFVHRLFVARRVVFRVLAQISEPARHLDALGDFLSLFRLQVFEFFDRLVIPFLRHDEFFRHFSLAPVIPYLLIKQ